MKKPYPIISRFIEQYEATIGPFTVNDLQDQLADNGAPDDLISRSTLYAWFNGGTRPSMSVLERICTIIGLNWECIVDEIPYNGDDHFIDDALEAFRAALNRVAKESAPTEDELSEGPKILRRDDFTRPRRLDGVLTKDPYGLWFNTFSIVVTGTTACLTVQHHIMRE